MSRFTSASPDDPPERDPPPAPEPEITPEPWPEEAPGQDLPDPGGDGSRPYAR